MKSLKITPLPYEKSLESSVRYEAYFENFGNSGICVIYNFDSDKDIMSKISNYKLLDDKLIVYDSSSYVYRIKDIQIPEISDDIYDEQIKEYKESKDYKIYLIENGTIGKAFKSSPIDKLDKSAKYFYSTGVYYFEKINKIVYWFLIYDNGPN